MGESMQNDTAVEKPTIRCPSCAMEMRRLSLRRHQQTLGCRIHGQHLKYLAQGWTDAFWHANDVRRERLLSQVTGCHVMKVDTGYSRGGWGHSSHTWKRHYVRQSLVDLYHSPQITAREFDMCCNLPENDPQYQALWTLARLGGTNE